MPIALVVGKEGELYALLHTKVIAVIETENLTITKSYEIKDYEPTALAYAAATNELYVKWR
jgi:hypothetical protein